MNSLLPGNEVTYMPPLKEWPPSDSTPRPVGGSSGAPGMPADTWETVAQQLGMDVRRLIFFNFKTNNPKEVNFYLRTVVGCNTPSPSRWNWTFRNAKPGIIYLPVITKDFSDDPDDERVGPGVPDFKPEVPDFSFKDPEWAKKLVEQIEKRGQWGKVFKITKWLLWITVGAPTQAYIRDNCEKEYFSGISRGIVLGADKRPRDFIIRLGFQNHIGHDPEPKIDNLYQIAYTAGLVTGLDYADRMNETQRSRLRNAVRSHMDRSDYPDLNDKDAWRKGRFLSNYYVIAAGSFRNFLLQYWLNGSLQMQLQIIDKQLRAKGGLW